MVRVFGIDLKIYFINLRKKILNYKGNVLYLFLEASAELNYELETKNYELEEIINQLINQLISKFIIPN